MKFCLEIGTVEKHTIEFNFSQLFGRLSIKVDNREVKKNQWLLNEPLAEIYDLNVGERENIAVRIEKKRKPLFGNRCRVFLNQRLMKVQDGV